MNDSTSDGPKDDALDRGLDAAFRASHRKTGTESVFDVIERFGGEQPRITLREEPSGLGDRPLKPVRGPTSTVPMTAGKYHIQGEVARGGVGAVYKGHDTELGRDVAMKLLHEQYVSRPEVLQRFVEEAQIGGQLQHPGIVPVYDLGMTGDRPYFTMKLIKGQTLSSLLEDRSTPREGRRKLLSIFEQVCQTMAYAHTRGVIHRDLKPANIMVGPFGEVQVVDWGMGKVLPRGGVADEARSRQRSKVSVIETIRSDADGSKSQIGSVMGTPAYMPPEQANGAVEQMDERSDVFALGAVLCEILTGEPPYVGNSADLLRAAAKAELEPCTARLLACNADEQIIELARDCLLPVPAARPRDARRVTERLADYLADVEERARLAQIDAAEHRVQAVAARRSLRLTMALAASVLIILGLGGGGLWWIDHQERSRAEALRGQIEAALADAHDAFNRARMATVGDLTAWMETVAALDRAEVLASDPAAEPELLERIAALSDQAQQDRARAVAEAREVEIVARFELIINPTDDADLTLSPLAETTCRRKIEAYTGLFAESGLPLGEMDHNEAVLALIEKADPSPWLSAIDDWAFSLEVLHGPESPQRLHLLQIIAEIDPDPFHQRWLDLLIRGDVDADSVRELLGSGESRRMSASMALSVARRLEDLEEFRLRVEVLEMAQFFHPTDFRVILRLAQCFHDGMPPTDHAEALRYFTAASALRPENAHVNHERGHCALNTDRYGEAEFFLRQALELEPERYRAMQHLSRVLRITGQTTEASHWLRQCIEHRPNADHARNYLELIDLLLETGDESGALEAIEEALVEYPHRALALNDLAWFFATTEDTHLRDPERGLDLARRAVELDPKNWNTRNTLGAALYRTGHYEECVEVLWQNVRGQHQEDRSYDYLLLSMAEHRLGAVEQARDHFGKAIELIGKIDEDDDEHLIEEARAMLGIDER